MNWQIQKTEINSRALKYTYQDADSRVLTFRNVIELWADAVDGGESFRSLHCQTLRDVPFQAIRWETPVVDTARIDRPFEFVALNSPGLDRREDQTAFQDQFDATDGGDSTIAFPNLGKNAILVVPLPSAIDVNHCHLASYLRTCTARDESAFWRQVGLAMLERVSDKPVWLSTAGGGVAWLHVRLDDRPKYYSYQKYKSK